VLQTQEQQHIIITGLRCTARTIAGRPACFIKGVHFIIIIIFMAQQLRGHVIKFQKMPR
jgi:hypothetical protein